MTGSVGRKMKVRCITNRHLAVQDYDTQIAEIAAARPEAIIVREKDFTEPEYEQLAKRVMDICTQYGVSCILHNFVGAALRLGAEAVHLPMHKLLALTRQEKAGFSVIGASVHSLEEALEAQKAGAAYLTASHIYATDCKKGAPPRGIPFLQEVCAKVSIPVYALGGICAANAPSCIQAGAAGVCIMSECMKHADVKQVLQKYTL